MKSILGSLNRVKEKVPFQIKVGENHSIVRPSSQVQGLFNQNPSKSLI